MLDLAEKNEKLKELERLQTKKPAVEARPISRKYSGKPKESPTIAKKEEKVLGTEDMTSYLSAFKSIQDEFTFIKDSIKIIKKKQKNHSHPDIELQLQKISTSTIKIETDNKVIQREHSELIHALHLLSTKLLKI